MSAFILIIFLSKNAAGGVDVEAIPFDDGMACHQAAEQLNAIKLVYQSAAFCFQRSR